MINSLLSKTCTQKVTLITFQRLPGRPPASHGRVRPEQHVRASPAHRSQGSDRGQPSQVRSQDVRVWPRAPQVLRAHRVPAQRCSHLHSGRWQTTRRRVGLGDRMGKALRRWDFMSQNVSNRVTLNDCDIFERFELKSVTDDFQPQLNKDDVILLQC